MSKARDLADFISTGSILSDGTIESTEISGVTADATEINKLDGLTADTAELNKLDGVTATTAELNKLAGTTATTSDFDKLSNVTASATELNYMSGATSSIQNQLDNISVTSGSLTKSFTNGETASITLSSALSTAPVVGVTKEVAQTGISSKGAWDVNATASNYELHNTAYDTTLTKSVVTNTNISGASYSSKSFDVSSQDSSPKGTFFKTDGTIMYVVVAGGDYIYQYDLSTAWDVSTASYASKSFFLGGSEYTPEAIYFKSDGLTAYFLGSYNDHIRELTLSTAWDISTASYNSSSVLSLSTIDIASKGLFFKDDGTKFYIAGNNTDSIIEIPLSTAWDLSTAGSTVSFNVSSQTANPCGVTFNSAGTKMYVAGETSASIYQYTLSTAWDVSTASYDSVSLDASSQSGNIQDVILGDNGTKIYVTGSQGHDPSVFQYTNTSNALALGTGSFASTDVGKRIQGNGGDVILTSTAGAYSTTGGSDFTDSSTIASGSWTMHGLKSAGATDGLTLAGLATSTPYTVQGQNVISETLTLSSLPNFSFYTGIEFGDSGNKLFITGGDNSNSYVYQYSLSTAYDVSTGSYDGAGSVISLITYTNGSTFNADGTRVLVCDAGNNFIRTYSLSTAWDVTSGLNNVQNFGLSFQPSGCTFGDNGNYFYALNVNGSLYRYNLATAYDLNSSLGFDGPYGVQGSSVEDVKFNADGTKFFVLNDSADTIDVYSCSTAWGIASGVTHESSLVKDVSGIGTNIRGFDFGGTNNEKIVYATSPVAVTSSLSAQIPTSSYHIAATNSGGQIDSSTWIDINSMTADQSLGDGEAYYAVSTDDRTTWSVAKASDGVRPIVRDNAGTWQYNNEQGTTVAFSIANGSYDSKSFSVASQDTAPRGMTFNNDGTKMYIGGNTNDQIFEYVLSTANDISTASYNSVSLNIQSQDSAIQGITFNNDGTQLYMLGSNTDSAYQYTLTTAFDLSTASYASKSISVTTEDTTPRGLVFKPDGTKMYIVGGSNSSIFQYSLSTADDLSTASYDSVSFSITGITSLSSMAFNNDGTKMFVYGYSTGDAVQQYSLSTAYDISTASYDSVSFSLQSEDGQIASIEFSSDGTKMFASGDTSNTVYQYSTEEIGFTTSTTWTNATTNDEFYALQEALGATSLNRMDKTQLDAVADGSHFTLGDTLDLAIALKQDTASASLPTSDGVSINYDAQALNQGAVLGTDYDYDFPDSTTVRITSNAAQNLKIRVV